MTKEITAIVLWQSPKAMNNHWNHLCMGYLIDRHEAFRETELVAIISLRRRGVRSRLLLRGGSLRHTLTRPGTLVRRLRGAPQQHEGDRWQNVPPRRNA